MNPLSSNRAVPRGRQRGAVTLVITMLILVAVALGMYSMVGTTSIESRMTDILEERTPTNPMP